MAPTCKPQINAGSSALRNAVRAGELETAKLLLDRGARLDADATGSSDLSIAAGQGDQEMVGLLLAHGADPNYDKGRSALTAALLAQKPQIVRRLIEAGAQLDRRLDPGDVPPLVLSAYSEVGNREIAELMISQGVDVSVANERGETVLTWARKRGFPQFVKLLEAQGARDSTEKQGKTIPVRAITVDPSDLQPLLTGRLQQSISLLQHSSDVFLAKRKNCVSCHHQNLPSIAIGWARDRGLSVDDASIKRMVQGQLRSWRPRIERAYQMDRPVPVAPRFIGYGTVGICNARLSSRRSDRCLGVLFGKHPTPRRTLGPRDVAAAAGGGRDLGDRTGDAVVTALSTGGA